MNCKNIKQKLIDYIDGTLDDRDIEIVENHIAECESCRKELEIFNKLTNYMQKVDYPPTVIWENFLSDLHKRIEKEAVSNFMKENKPKFSSTWIWSFITALSIIFLVSSILLEYKSIDYSQKHSIPQTKTSIRPSSIENSESYVIADIVSKTFIDDKRMIELRKLQKINDFTIYLPINNEFYSILSETIQPDSNDKDNIKSLLNDDLFNSKYIDQAEYYASESGPM